MRVLVAVDRLCLYNVLQSNEKEKPDATAQNADVVTMNFDAYFSLEPIAPLFNKELYDKQNEFTIKFKL